MQRQLGVDQPDYRHLADDMFPLESQPIPVDRFISPKVNQRSPLGESLIGPGITVAEPISTVDNGLGSVTATFAAPTRSKEN
ncbi:hypothetical protein AB0B25_29070 [Nocardia sp. NPDC049190]|uniref:hypothetical protein n=1 Tax=Nocardia sp. NPDC049190 TaxID=3155650 RepID=UPI003400DE3B